MLGHLCLMQAEVSSKRQLLQQHLLHHLSHIPTSTGPPAASFRLLQLSGAAPAAALLDLLPCAWQPQLLLQFNPFLSAAAVARLHRAVLVWLQLCVLEDKLGRLQQLLLAGPDGVAALIQVRCGLRCYRQSPSFPNAVYVSPQPS
jgi:hypothetical protein